MVTVAIRALGLEYLVKILDWGRSRSWYFSFRLHLKIPSDSDSTALEETIEKCSIRFLLKATSSGTSVSCG
jgi:hypothetical protein